MTCGLCLFEAKKLKKGKSVYKMKNK